MRRALFSAGILTLVLAWPSAASAQLAFCMQNTAFTDRYDLVVTGPSGAGSSLLVGSERGSARTVDGAIRIGVGNGAVIQWRKSFPNGTNHYFCDVSIFGTGPGSITRLLSGGINEVVAMTCSLCGSSPDTEEPDSSEIP